MVVFLVEGTTISILMASALRVWRNALNQRDWFSAALAAMSDAVVALDNNGVVTYLNPAARAVTGWRLEEAAGQPAEKVLRLVDPDTRQPFSALNDRGSTQSCLMIARDESEILVERRVTTLLEDGVAAGTLVILRDRTEWHERRRSEEHLRESERRSRHLADAMPQIIWTAGPDGSVDYYNERWFEYTGLTPEQTFLADGWWRLVLHPDDVGPCAAQWAQAVREFKPFQIECRFKHASPNEYRWFLGRAEPVADEPGGPVRWYGTCTDIDEQKRTEEMLKEVGRRKDEFLAVLSHELRNPLAPILNALQILSTTAMPDSESEEARDVIDRQIRHVASMVDDLLDMFRISHRKFVLLREPIDLVTRVHRIVEDYRRPLEDSGLRVELELPDEPVWVTADRRRLAQVISNLLQNAAKFTNPGGCVTVRVELDREAHRVALSIRDTGLGMTPEVLRDVFEMFVQGKQNLARREGGLGLGLALVKGIVELHGGRVKASSPGPGKGSEFSFWLPLCRKPAMPSRTLSAVPAPALELNGKGRLRVLIVEDNEDAAQTLVVLLKRFGHDVRMAYTGQAGINLAKSWHPDVILCDLGLPDKDGYEVASELRHDPETSTARLIAVSGYGQEEDRRRTEESGFDLHLTKPVDPMELKRLLTVLKVGA